MVLPPASHKHLSKALWPLVLEASSPIADLFPTQFSTDGEGKRAEYEAVVLLPFVDKERLVAAFDAVPDEHFAPGELKRNDVGSILVFTHQADSSETEFCKSTLLTYARDVAHPESRCTHREPVPALTDGQPGFEPKVLQVCFRGGCAFERCVANTGSCPPCNATEVCETASGRRGLRCIAAAMRPCSISADVTVFVATGVPAR